MHSVDDAWQLLVIIHQGLRLLLISYECFWPTCWYPYSIRSLLGTRHIYTTHAQLFLLVFRAEYEGREKNHSIYSILVIFHQFCQSILMMRIVCLGRHRAARHSLAVTLWLQAQRVQCITTRAWQRERGREIGFRINLNIRSGCINIVLCVWV